MLFLLVVGWIFEISFICQVFTNTSAFSVAVYWGLIMAVATAIISKKW